MAHHAPIAGDQHESIYIHGTDPNEQMRLSVLNAFMNGPSLREINVQPGDRVLDIGSGLGQLTRGMARAIGSPGYVLGIEREAKQIAEAVRQAREAGEENLVEFRQGNAYDPPLRDSEWGTIDVAHARFVLEHVPDPLRVVRSMFRAVKPGGRVVLEDDDHDVLRLSPEPTHFRVFWDAYVKTYEHVGNDPFVGRKLVSILHQAGAEPVRNTWIFFGTCKGQDNFAAAVTNFNGIVHFSRRDIVNAGLLDAKTFDAFEAEFQDWSQRPDAALWYAICFAEGRKPRTA